MEKVAPVSKKASGRVAALPLRAKAPPKRKRNRAGRPTLDELERRKLKVMEVATEMFIRRGFAATTLLDIAKKAGVATRTLYQHFGDKEAIFREVIFARDTAKIDPPVLAEVEDLDSALRKAAHYSYQVALRSRSIELMRLMIAESARFPDLMTKIATTIFTRFTSNVAALFRELAERKLIPDGDHDQSAELFVDLLLGNHTVMIYFGWASAAPTEADIEVKIDLFINGRFGASRPKASSKSTKPVAKRKS
ncbi:TetR/AcrR family transcriptional regulator [Novosphingobium sp. G106]|uniref:TetR/AcrR family transcriptional regulator n=1 Tax=Novosphingobium sp. G106 TaxID=2849500 RepID=UPI001C2D3F5A|nr:TetR/AcrR family transcriptional regulator [Novosphingobium sp. G106]MBV1687869.1 TetR/AcrR family transcriptional regulator [Novosphingobium sp. G106]